MSLLFSQSSRPPAALLQSEGRLGDWLDQFEGRLEKVAVAYNSASFNKYAGRPAADLNRLDADFVALLNDPHAQATVRYWRDRASDPLLHRRLELLDRTFLEAEVSKSTAIYQLRNSINDRLISYRPVVSGQSLSRGEVLDILQADPNRRRRRRAYEEALRPLASELAGPVAQLLHQRNLAAHRLGYPTYADLHLALTGFDRPTLLNLFSRLEKASRQPYRDFVEEGRQTYGLEQVEAWDLQWLAEQPSNLPQPPFAGDQSEAQIYRLLAQFGLEGAKLPIEIVRHNIPFGGLCFSVRVPDDIRILCNPKSNYAGFRTLLHEFGHGLHSAFNRQPSYILKREWGAFSEGMAETLAYFTHDDQWIAATTGLNPTAINEYQHYQRYRRLFRLRNLMAQAHFEIEAYDDPAANLDQLLAQHEAHYLMIPPNATPRWAASPFPTTHPLYRHNYILADMIAAQTHATLKARFGAFFEAGDDQKKAVMTFLKENYYGPGASVEWREKIRQATSQILSPTALLTELGLATD